MNAAFLLVTTAWLAGADPAPAAAPAPAPVAAAPTAGCGSCGGCASTCGSCGSCCEHEGLLAKLRARFHRDECDCAPSCGCGAKYAPAPTFHAGDCGCGCDEGPGLLDRLKARFAKNDCGCNTGCGATCDACGDRAGLLDRLKARFHRDSCCDSCGSTCGGCGGGGYGGYGGAVTPHPATQPGAEPLKMPKEGDAAPKKLPDGKDNTGATAPKDLDLTPTAGKAIVPDSRRPF